MRHNKIDDWGLFMEPLAEKELALFLDSCLRENAPGLLPEALRHIALLKGFTALSRDTGIRRTSLYRLLSLEADPSFSDILKITRALGFKLHFEALSTQGSPTIAARDVGR
jgi:probable addiction module antidote protein